MGSSSSCFNFRSCVIVRFSRESFVEHCADKFNICIAPERFAHMSRKWVRVLRVLVALEYLRIRCTSVIVSKTRILTRFVGN